MLKIAICDDDFNFLGIMETELDRLGKLYHYPLSIEAYSSGKELIKDFDDNLSFDFIFLDIEMKDLDGIETAKYIRKQNYHLPIIYVSSHEEYLKQLFEVEPFRFLQKPLEPQALENVFLQVIKRVEEQNDNYYIFQAGKNVTKLQCKDILYFESFGRKVIIHTLSKDYTYYDKLNSVEEKVQNFRFVRIHKAYLVNMDNIEAFQYERVALIDGTILNISEKNRPKIREEFWNYCRNTSSR